MTWILKRNEQDFQTDIPTPKQWAAEGKVGADDYIYNPVLQKWLYAKDTAEIASAFTAVAARQATKEKAKKASNLNMLGFAFGVPGMLIGMATPIIPQFMPFAILLIGLGVLFSIAYYVKRN
jgi:hypothetical protein